MKIQSDQEYLDSLPSWSGRWIFCSANILESGDDTQLRGTERRALALARAGGVSPDLRWWAQWPDRDGEYSAVWTALIRDNQSVPRAVWVSPIDNGLFDDTVIFPSEIIPLDPTQAALPAGLRLYLGHDIAEQLAGPSTVNLVRWPRTGIMVKNFMAEVQGRAAARYKILHGGPVEVPTNDEAWNTWRPRERTTSVFIWATFEDAQPLANRLVEAGVDARIMGPPEPLREIDGWMELVERLSSALDIGMVKEEW